MRQLNLGERRSAFLNTWKKLFKELNGWSEEQTLEWSEKWSVALSGRAPSAVIYHYGPLKTAVSGLLDEKTKRLAGDRLIDLRNDVLKLLMYPNGQEFPAILHPDAVEEYDWGSVRRRLEQIKAKYSRLTK